MSLKTKRLLIRFIVHLPIIGLLMIALLISNNTSNTSSIAFLGLIVLLYLATLRINPLPGIIERRKIQEVHCWACGEIIKLVDTWACSCNFVTWEPRHAFSPCPNPDCKKTYAWLVCPRCERSIPI